MKNRNNIVIIIIAIFVLVVLLMQLKPKEDEEIAKDTSNNEEAVIQDDSFDITDIGASDGGDAGILETSLGKYTIRQGSDIYSLDSISFAFTASNALQMHEEVRMQINNFTRNNRPIELGSFRLGSYPGTCSELGAMQNSTLGQSLGLAQCGSGDSAYQIAVFLQGKMMSVYTSQTGPANFAEILAIDLSKLVQ